MKFGELCRKFVAIARGRLTDPLVLTDLKFYWLFVGKSAF